MKMCEGVGVQTHVFFFIHSFINTVDQDALI
jgi:hypothetical protein